MPLEADFTSPLTLPDAVRNMPRLGFFPGSTIGNMVPSAAIDLLRAMRETLGAGALLLIGIDRLKDAETLVRAYDDTQGVTAAFNLNLLHRINRELDGDIPVSAFRHAAFGTDGMRASKCTWRRPAIWPSPSMAGFTMALGETIHTENSHKYGTEGARLLLRAGSWLPVRHWTDPEKKFALILARAEPLQPE